jgi:hypothetical protein
LDQDRQHQYPIAPDADQCLLLDICKDFPKLSTFLTEDYDSQAMAQVVLLAYFQKEKQQVEETRVAYMLACHH